MASLEETTQASGADAARTSHAAVDGIFAGLLGGLAVAVLFLGVDAFEGQPLFTPSLLGSALFQGKSFESVQGVDLPMALAYTGVHLLVFVVIGLAAAYMVAQFEKNPSFGLLLLLLFVFFEAGFIAFTIAFMPGVLGALASCVVLAANLLSAGVMAGYLLWWSRPRADRANREG